MRQFFQAFNILVTLSIDGLADPKPLLVLTRKCEFEMDLDWKPHLVEIRFWVKFAGRVRKER